MSSYIDLDSYYRDRESYPNENAYELLPDQVQLWTKQPRQTVTFSRNPGLRPLEFVVTIRLISIQLPYSADIADIPKIYVNFESKNYKDVRLVDAIGGIHSDVKFVCSFDKLQYDALNNPAWIHYKCRMIQTMRFEKGEPVIVSITTRSGMVLPQQDNPPSLPPIPSKQSLLTFQITPYELDGAFSDTRNSQPLVL